MWLTRALTRPSTRTPAPPGGWQASRLDSDKEREDKAKVAGGQRGEVSDRRWSSQVQRWWLPSGQGSLSLDAESGSHMRLRSGHGPQPPPGSGIHIQTRGLQAPRPHATFLMPLLSSPPCPLIHCHLRAASSRPRRGPQAGGVHSSGLLSLGSEGRKPRTKLPSGLVLERASFPACRCRLAASSQPGCAGRAPASVPRKFRAHTCDLIPPCLPPSRPRLQVQSRWGVRASA